MLEELKEKVFQSNLDLVKLGLVIFTWGNVSQIDREQGLVVIKPSGVDYACMSAEDMTVVDMNGNIVEGKYKPSSDTLTHLEIYKKLGSVNAIVHTHSVNATAFAQSGKEIKAYGTTHADYFYKDIPVTRSLTKEEVESAYELNTGRIIVERLKGEDVMATPAILVRNHGVFAFGTDSANAVYNAKVVEEVAELAFKTQLINPKTLRLPQYLLDKHYKRKHGKDAYYGQEDRK